MPFERFVQVYFASPVIWVEWISFILSMFMVFKKRFKGGVILSFTHGVIVLFEALAIGFALAIGKNDLVYSALLPFMFLGYLAYYYQNISSPAFRKTILLMMAAFCISFLYSPIWVSGNSWIPVAPFLTGGFAMVITSTFAFIEISQIRHRHSLRNDPLFWVSCAVMVYFFPTSILVGAFKFFLDVAASEYGTAFWNSQKILNILHYSLFSFAFVCRFVFPGNLRS